MSDLLEKRTIQERLIIVKTLLETVLDDLPSELSNNSKELENKNGELISREEVLKLPQRKGYAVNGWETYIRVSDIKELPAVQPKERCIANITLNEEDLERIVKEQVEEIKDSLTRKGKWIPVDSYSAFGGDGATWVAHGNPVAFYYCSECKEQAYAGEDGESLITDYCPNCGCRMEEGDSE